MGKPRLLSKLIARARGLIYWSQTMVVYTADLSQHVQHEVRSDAIVHVADVADIPALAEVRSVPNRKVWEKMMRDRLAHGDLCVVAKLGAEVVSFAWARRGVFVAPGDVPVSLSPGCAEYFWAFTAPEHRSKGFQKLLYDYLCEELLREGAQCLVWRVTENNLPALRNYDRFGQRTGAVRTLKVLSLYRRVKLDVPTICQGKDSTSALGSDRGDLRPIS